MKKLYKGHEHISFAPQSTPCVSRGKLAPQPNTKREKKDVSWRSFHFEIEFLIQRVHAFVGLRSLTKSSLGIFMLRTHENYDEWKIFIQVSSFSLVLTLNRGNQIKSAEAAALPIFPSALCTTIVETGKLDFELVNQTKQLIEVSAFNLQNINHNRHHRTLFCSWRWLLTLKPQRNYSSVHFDYLIPRLFNFLFIPWNDVSSSLT